MWSWLFLVWAACPFSFSRREAEGWTSLFILSDKINKAHFTHNLVLSPPPAGSPPPKVRWFKNGLEVHPEQSGLSMSQDGALVISAVSASHSGDFKCVAVNEAGSVERKTRLKVNGETQYILNKIPLKRDPDIQQSFLLFSCNTLVPPEIQDDGQPLNLTVTLKQPLTLGCDAFGIPSPSITWTKDGHPVSLSS